jgi:hypothetical protein
VMLAVLGPGAGAAAVADGCDEQAVSERRAAKRAYFFIVSLFVRGKTCTVHGRDGW